LTATGGSTWSASTPSASRPATLEFGVSEVYVTTYAGLSPAEKRLKRHQLNSNRRHLTAGQRRELIEAELRWWATNKKKLPSSRELAAVFGCSQQTVCNVAKRSGVQIGHLPTQGKDGKTYQARPIVAPTPHQRFGEVKKDIKDAGELPPRVLRPKVVQKLAAEARRAKGRQGQVVMPRADEDIRLFPCRFQELEQVAGIGPNSVNLFLTDIPYEQAFLPQVDDLGQLAQRTLVEGGLLVLHTAQAWLNQIIASLDNYLTYRWTAAFV
jgi:hypothetical protein